ncbi:MAG TPA: DUF4129 domain-containing protein [Pyrinomonadaceae bacterium]|nr:DUF4129 domain-containing protein [Pyrinomonadaceae bacterium]
MRVALSRMSLKKAPRHACVLLLLLAALASTSAARQRPIVHPTPDKRSVPRASTLADYRGRVGAAVAPLEELASLYERVRQSEDPKVWSKPGFNSDFVLEVPKKEEAAGRVLALLPPHERVESGGSFVEVDNSWLHEAVGQSKREGDRRKSVQLLRGAAERLRALEAQLGEAESAPQDKDAERGRLNSILRDPSFNRDTRHEEGALARLLREFFEWLARLFQRNERPVMPGASPGATNAAQVVVFALCAVVLLYVGWRLWRRRRGAVTLKLKREPRVILGERLEADATASGLLDDAERLARAGDLRGAIRKAYVALLLELGDRGVLRLSRHRTNRDYLNAVRRAAAPGLYTAMLPLTFDFELHWYGLRDASDADWESFRTRCRQILKQSEA